jgi:hypothetical protein
MDWSIDDFLNWRCAPDEDFMPALAALRDQMLVGFKVSGWRCSWDRYGRKCKTDGRREIIPALAVVDLTFDVLPDSWDAVLICGNRLFREQSADEAAFEQRYGDDVLHDRIEGWGELRLGESDARAIWEVATKRAGHNPTRKEKIRAWMTKWIEGRMRGSQEIVWKAAQIEFGGAARRDDVLPIYNDLAPAAWKRKGRRRPDKGLIPLK